MPSDRYQSSRHRQAEYDVYGRDYNHFRGELAAVVDLENRYKKRTYDKGPSTTHRPFNREVRLCKWEYPVPSSSRLPSAREDYLLKQTSDLLMKKTGVLYACGTVRTGGGLLLKVVGVEAMVEAAREHVRRIENKEIGREAGHHSHPALAYLSALPNPTPPLDLNCGLLPPSLSLRAVTTVKAFPIGIGTLRRGCGQTEEERILNLKKLAVHSGCTYEQQMQVPPYVHVKFVGIPEALVRVNSLLIAMDNHRGLMAQRILDSTHGFEPPEPAAITIADTPSGAVEHPEPHHTGSKRGPGEELEGDQGAMAPWSTPGKRFKQRDLNEYKIVFAHQGSFSPPELQDMRTRVSTLVNHITPAADRSVGPDGLIPAAALKANSDPLDRTLLVYVAAPELNRDANIVGYCRYHGENVRKQKPPYERPDRMAGRGLVIYIEAIALDESVRGRDNLLKVVSLTGGGVVDVKEQQVSEALLASAVREIVKHSGGTCIERPICCVIREKNWASRSLFLRVFRRQGFTVYRGSQEYTQEVEKQERMAWMAAKELQKQAASQAGGEGGEEKEAEDGGGAVDNKDKGHKEDPKEAQRREDDAEYGITQAWYFFGPQ